MSEVPYVLSSSALGRAVPVRRTDEGLRAVSRGQTPVEPASVEKYLASKFGDALPAARDAMAKLAQSRDRETLAEEAFGLYEAFRPSIPPGEAGWGAKGTLDLGKLDVLARNSR